MTMTSKYKHWTDGVRINPRFIETLEHAVGGRRFTNAEAYHLYHEFHARDPLANFEFTEKEYSTSIEAALRIHKIAKEGDDWMKMNVRNQLCKMVRLGLLRRVRPGVYEWTANLTGLTKALGLATALAYIIMLAAAGIIGR
jgi:hypothetical protein